MNVFGLRLNFLAPKAHSPSAAASHPGGLHNAFASIFGPNASPPSTPAELLSKARDEVKKYSNGAKLQGCEGYERNHQGQTLMNPVQALAVLERELRYAKPSPGGKYSAIEYLKRETQPVALSQSLVQAAKSTADLKVFSSLEASRGRAQLVTVPEGIRRDKIVPDQFVALPVGGFADKVDPPVVSAVPAIVDPPPVLRFNATPAPARISAPRRGFGFAAAFAALAGIFR